MVGAGRHKPPPLHTLFDRQTESVAFVSKMDDDLRRWGRVGTSPPPPHTLFDRQTEPVAFVFKMDDDLRRWGRVGTSPLPRTPCLTAKQSRWGSWEVWTTT